MECAQVTWPLVSVQHQKGVINPTPDYQRYSVWTKDQQQLLIDTIYRGMDIPKLYLRELPSGGKYKYEAVDGQQRMRAVWDFFDDRFPLNSKYTPELAGLKYSELDNETRLTIDHYQFNLVVIKKAEDAEIREMFCRLQNGKPLNAAEKRNAMVSAMRDFCAELAGHELFKSVRFGNGRMQHQQVAAQTVLLELVGKPTDVRNTKLSRMYQEKHDFDKGGSVAKKVKKVYNFLHKCFPEKTPELKRSNVVSSYLLATTLMGEYNLNGHEKDFHEFLIDFEARRRTEEDNVQFIKYSEAVAHASDGEESIAFRHRMLLEELHKFCPDLIPLDSRRAFDEGQRIAIYRRDGGKCKYCGDAVPWDKFNADHVVAHSTGGPTTVANGRLACDSCNKSKGAKVVEAG